MFNLNEALKSLDLKELWECEDYEKEILEDIEKFFKEESENQNWIEENLRSK